MGRVRSPQRPGGRGQGLGDPAPGHHGSRLPGLCEGLGVTPIKAWGLGSADGVWRHLGRWPQNISKGFGKNQTLCGASCGGTPHAVGRHSGKLAPGSVVGTQSCPRVLWERGPEALQGVGEQPLLQRSQWSPLCSVDPGPQGCSPSGPFPLLTFGLRVREGLYMKGRARGKWLVPPGVHCLSLGASCTSQAPLEEAGRGC